MSRIDSLVGELGDKETEVVNNIVTMWLYQNPIPTKKIKKELTINEKVPLFSDLR